MSEYLLVPIETKLHMSCNQGCTDPVHRINIDASSDLIQPFEYPEMISSERIFYVHVIRMSLLPPLFIYERPPHVFFHKNDLHKYQTVRLPDSKSGEKRALE